ncbi:hypothetical protein PAXRUDRAFT_166368 [Paxillus rubicundulus Ve08.2h10]|uniref:ATP-dependent DNA helicase n=1 Tax=Paxillus rubicundulus Ve08.2h10 TaxID=930991 RepID=A0A0D0DHQ1_9AGAM|nr:hypothetical protein PAXRUDRAFT_176110 [Paxillus rubicundulus Ve08.2h10]KIK77590.1 hypothetical protein PAXRUDRAFT_166368 [Paxillus rubicundulus Ve08.2h10]
MLLWNLDPSHGLHNGTCMFLVVQGGDCDIVLIPCMSLDANKEEFTVPLCCHQFPVCLAFAMAINKSQGQSVQHVGLDLHTPVFSHGQLYVALSCCTHPHNIKVIFPQDQNTTKTTNVVFTEVLRGLIEV